MLDSYRTTEVFENLPPSVSGIERNESGHGQYTDIEKHKYASACPY
jgi:hypothetical protein